MPDGTGGSAYRPRHGATVRPEAEGRSISKHVLVAVGLAGAVVVVLLILGYLLYHTSAPLSTTKAFVASVETNDYDAAYSQFHADLQRREPFAEFVERWSGRDLDLHDTNRLWSTNVETQTADFDVRFTTPDGKHWSASFQLVQQDDLWRINDYHFLDGSLDAR